MLINLRSSSVLVCLLVVAAVGMDVVSAEPAAKLNRLLIVRDGKYGYIDRAGQVVVPLQFPYSLDFVEGMARVELGEQWTYINEAGELMKKKFDQPARFADSFYDFSDGLAVHRVGGKEERTPDGYHMIVVGGKYGYIDKAGTVIIPVAFDGAGRFRMGLAAVKKQDKWGYIDKTGRSVIAPAFEDAGEFSNGLAPVLLEEKWGLINAQGKLVVAPKFDEISDFHDGLARVLFAEKFGYLDLRGNIVIESKYDYAGDFSCERALVRVGDNDDPRFGYIDKQGKLAIPAQFGEAQDFSDGLAAVKIERPFSSKEGPDNSWGYIDTSGAYVIAPRFYQVHEFSEGLAAASPQPSAGYGYVDRSGKFVIEPQFDYRTGPFRDGIARVYTDRNAKTQDDHGYIDPTGKFLWPLRSVTSTP
jgi:hypothetical protein